MQTPVGSLSGTDLQSCLHQLGPELERFARQRFGETVEMAGWQNFSRWGMAAISHEQDIYQTAFTAWWLFSWLPDDQDLKGEQFLVPAPDHAIGADYLSLHRAKLSPLKTRIIERALTSPYSFYALKSVEAGNRLRLQEIYTQKQVMVEGGASAAFEPGQVLFTAVLSVDGVSMLLGPMPLTLGAAAQVKIENHRDKWREEAGKAIDQRLLYLHDTELRRYYFLLLSQKQQANLH